MMQLQEEAEYIYRTLINKHPVIAPWSDFHKDKTKKPAAREFINTKINSRLQGRPELLTCMLHPEPGFGFGYSAIPLFLFVQRWICENYLYGDAEYSKQFYNWLISETALLPSKLSSNLRDCCVDSFLYLLTTHNLVFLEFVNLDELILAIRRQIPNSEVVLQKLNQHVLDTQYEAIKAHEDTTAWGRQRFVDFVKLMQREAIFDANTEVKHIDYNCRDYVDPKEYSENALQFFTSQKAMEYKKLLASSEPRPIEAVKSAVAAPQKKPKLVV